MYVFRKTANSRGAFVYRNGPKWVKKSKWTTRTDLNMYVYCIRTGWPSIVIVKFGQMNILTHENATVYGGVITCLLACDSVCSTRR